MIPTRPIQRPGERILAFYHRVNEWEKIAKPLMAKESRAIDSMYARPAISTHKATTRQLDYDRRTLQDYAENNPVLCKILRRMDRSKL